MLSEKRAKSKTTVEKIFYKLLANSTYGKFVETGLKQMKVKFATTWNEREAIIQKHGYDMIAGTTLYSENLIGIKLNTPVRKVEKPFFIGFAILEMSKHIIYDFFYNVLKKTFDNVELLDQDTDSLIVQLSDKGNIVHKMCEMYKSFHLSELDELLLWRTRKLLRTGSGQEQIPLIVIIPQLQQEAVWTDLQGQAQRTSHHRVREN